jgi:3-oxo-4,17-pregnadiene-20-carboxyl-CoA hydratase beta subunit
MIPSSLRFGAVQVGQALPAQAVPVTTAGVIASSIAARDFHAFHQNPDFAREQGHPQVFLSGLVSSGLAQRFVTDWAGPEARLLSHSMRLGVPHYAGETLLLTGSVTGQSQDRDRWIEVTVVGANSFGQHLQSVVRLELV